MAESDNFEEDLFADLYVHIPPFQGIDDIPALISSHLATSSQRKANADLSYTEDDSTAKPESAPAEFNSEPTVKAEAEEPVQQEQNIQGDEHMYKDEQDMDDEIDFNLGNGNGNSNGHGYDAPASHEQHGPGIKEDG